MLINLWGGEPPTDMHMEVWTIYKYFPERGERLCDGAWTERWEVGGHFWSKSEKENVRIVSMPLGEYVKLHVENCEGMNEFWTLARVKTLIRPEFRDALLEYNGYPA